MGNNRDDQPDTGWDWYEFTDLFSRRDEQLDVLIQKLDKLLARLGAVEPPEIPPIPPPEVTVKPIIEIKGDLGLKIEEPIETTPTDEAITKNPNIILKTVGDTPEKLVSENDGRRRLMVQNRGTNDLYLAFEKFITTDRAIRILAGENFYYDNYTGGLYAMCDTGLTNDVGIVEAFKQ